ncbi:hypothetical protein ASD89_23750 [Caulobacter sp. Root656]|nr:hypothetical protein ASD89_23750 [Caulobacter sp. Root656]
MIRELIDAAFAQKSAYRATADEAFRPKLWPATPFDDGIPTLQPGVFQPSSPMLKERFELFGRWTMSTHGHWLSVADMAALWSNVDTASDPLLEGVKASREAGEEDWPNEASALFKPQRLSLFAASDYTSEKIYLLWLDFEDEPELWVYDANGESRYRDLATYLQAYLAEDVSAASRSWRA